MVKVRMNTADVAAEVKCLRRLIGMRCANVYDLSPKTYMFKLMNSSGVTESGESEKVLLLMESGVRLHTTDYVRDKSTTPSGFTLKLRKHIRTRRLEDVRQLGYDRIILFQFGLGANAHYIILELYAQGNIMLTDSEFVVMTLLRSHRDDDKGLAIMSRHRYPIEACRVFERTTVTKLQLALDSLMAPVSNASIEVNEDVGNDSNKSKEKQGSHKNGKPPGSNKTSGDGARSKQATLKTVLGEVLGYGPALSEHIILDAGLVPNMKLGAESKIDTDCIEVLAQAVGKFEDWLEAVISGDRIPEGYILMQRASGKKESLPSEEGTLSQVYDEFCPILLNQFKSREFMKLDTFDAALDEFYSKIESQRAEQQQKAKEGSSMQKLNKIRLDQENRVLTLKKEVDHCVRMAELIEYNLDDVDAAILAVRVALANGMDWVDLAQMVKEEKKSGNPVAGLIDKLHLERNCMTLFLSNNLDEMDDDEKTRPVDKVEVDLALSAHANARKWYELKKRQESKQEKTVTAHEKAFKAAERKTRLQLSQEKTVAAISHMRKVHWFEKFNWFISSENYLVISGRDGQQNEMIVKRYMSKGDLYVHADLHGASSTVIKNHKPEQPIPPLTLNQTGCFTVCQSQAWDSKIVTSAWWVYPHQVSKTAPTGEYLTVGSFMIRGKKNFLPPHPLIMGFGILFRLDESSLGSHLNERRVKGEDEGGHDVDESGSFTENSDSGSEKEITIEGLKDMSKELNGPSNSTEDNCETKSDLVCGGISTQTVSVHLGLEAVDIAEVPVEDRAAMLNGIDDESVSDTSRKNFSSISPQLEDLIDRALELGSSNMSGKNHGPDSPQVGLVEDNHYEEQKASVRDKPYISKAERRRLAKGQKSGTVGSTVERASEECKENKHASEESKENNVSGVRADKNVQNSKPSSGRISRGQKGKLKKIKEKYAEQDEEERRIRMALLASAGKALRNEKNSQDGTTVGKGTKSISGPDDGLKICYKCKKVGHLSRDCQEHPDERGDAKAVVSKRTKDGGPEDMPDALLGSTTNEMDRITIEEDDIHEIGEDEREKLNDVDYLTGNPLANDILLYAVPVCGPYNALQTYKYRVKITPGTAKRGKAAKTAMNLFSHMPEATNREKELMKACTDPELVAAIIGNVKITAAGLTQLKQKQKKGKKASKGGS
ncbi:nuclear export mediator factor NEMF [Macadamia integrifolia]|uniref:nuclear export mediator factor NEMF n=1 Tax=Macadamia integrifolia TaxID=60698 RepID=UPI001C4EE8A0|nr:nuclear export mediator factor NEMF [Macadamia integrifolia]